MNSPECPFVGKNEDDFLNSEGVELKISLSFVQLLRSLAKYRTYYLRIAIGAI